MPPGSRVIRRAWGPADWRDLNLSAPARTWAARHRRGHHSRPGAGGLAGHGRSARTGIGARLAGVSQPARPGERRADRSPSVLSGAEANRSCNHSRPRSSGLALPSNPTHGTKRVSSAARRHLNSASWPRPRPYRRCPLWLPRGWVQKLGLWPQKVHPASPVPERIMTNRPVASSPARCHAYLRAAPEPDISGDSRPHREWRMGGGRKLPPVGGSQRPITPNPGQFAGDPQPPTGYRPSRDARRTPRQHPSEPAVR